MQITEEQITLKGKIRIEIENIYTHEKQVEEIENLIVTVCKTSIAQRLVGVDSPANKVGTISYLGLGTSTTAANVADTQLTAEYFRKAVSTASYSTNVATFTTFFTTAEANGSINEVGLFGDNATSTANSGILYAHRILGTTKTKTSSDTLTITWSITVS